VSNHEKHMDRHQARTFLTAEWRQLVMVNFTVDPSIVEPRVPAGTTLDSWNGKTILSVVGFRFGDTRVMGMPIPLHRDFDEVNFRFYVRREHPDGVRRGVVFIKELVPRYAIAAVARYLYNENYVTVRMAHTLRADADGSRELSYRWRHKGTWSDVGLRIRGEPAIPDDGSEEAFVTEHYWGYVTQRDGSTVEYQVEHPRWRVWRALDAHLSCDAADFYGREFASSLSAQPTSAFLADGSAVVVHRGRTIAETARREV